ncbi:glycosyltransferase family 39 protein [Verrucomicrobium sp. BvORR106]|uniref:glycosyltransferase family 39 protein n=1 Tax=Verrucomicrobium sp. BvORR106 TaxID=1403819 RepID=UPI000571198C|nr:glycosyltransferase family 39 protein [Verrucomicrobium sp. BvORR106]
MNIDRRYLTGLVVILVGLLAIRLAYWPATLIGGDSIGYAVGGLGTWIAHSPGYFGYCLLGWSINQIVGNIIDSYSLINVSAAMIGTFLCYPLARSFDLPRRQSLYATAAYGCSLCVLYFGNTALSYATEGMLATAIALCGQMSCRKKQAGWLIATTVLWAIAGALRQTTTAFLAPWYCYVLWRTGRPWLALLQIALASLIIFGWTKANNHYLAAASGNTGKSAGSAFWSMQVMMPTAYNHAQLGLGEKAEIEESNQFTGGYHWPFIEVAYVANDFLGWHLLPDYRSYNAPAPSLAHAGRLTLMQALKLGFYMLVSLPALLLLLYPGRRNFKLSASSKWFMSLWIVPPLGFFVVGHFGSFGYLQIFLAGLAVILAASIPSPEDTASPSLKMGTVGWLFVICTIAGPAFFLFAKPFQSVESNRKLADVLLFQYTGAGIKERYFVSRANTSAPGPAQLPEWRHFDQDQQIVDYVERQGGLGPTSYPIRAPKALPKPQ